jgi:hypothetical protein
MKKDIYGWHIKQGDYKRDTEYDDKYRRDRKIESNKKNALFVVAGLAICFVIYFILKAVSTV